MERMIIHLKVNSSMLYTHHITFLFGLLWSHDWNFHFGASVDWLLITMTFTSPFPPMYYICFFLYFYIVHRLGWFWPSDISLLFAFWVGGCLEGYEKGMRGDNKVVCSSLIFSHFFIAFSLLIPPFTLTPIHHLFPPLYIIDLPSSNIPSSFPIILYLIYIFFSFPYFFHFFRHTSFYFHKRGDVCNIFLTIFNIFFPHF